MALYKWIGGALGFMMAGPLGALSGLFIGYLIDSMVSNDKDATDGWNRNSSNGYNGSNQNQYFEGQRNSFLFSFLVLASYIINADKKIMHSEMECVRRFLRQNFGADAEEQGNHILLRLFDEQNKMDAQNPYQYKDVIRQCCAQIAQNMDYGQQLQLVNFLVIIAKADGNVCAEEIDALKFICMSMGISQEDLNSMLSIGGNNLEDAYNVLGITEDATDDEVKAAYRKMALKHHPDRVATLGEDIKRAAEKKFQEINEAKERIYKARGL
jgi:DnaJ like chaperone protein